MVDAAAPTNTFLTNPGAMRRAVETGGQSVVRGTQNFLHDLANNDGQPQQFAKGVYEVGKNMAVTPGKVVFRNDLMELIQYAPTTKTVHEIPLLFSPPWINKYYVMDLAPDRSLVQWAVDHGHTVFLISYRNPDESMRSVGMDDYLLSGPITALDVIQDITGQEKVNLLGLCLGGTLTMITLAYLDAIGQDRINSATFLNTLTDFKVPGALGVFTDEASVAKLEVHDGKDRFPAGRQHGQDVQHDARQRPHLELRRQQLDEGRGPARIRPADLERRLHPHAGRNALVLPAQLLPGEPAGQGRHGNCRRNPQHQVRRSGSVFPGRRAGPHRAVAQLLHGCPIAVR